MVLETENRVFGLCKSELLHLVQCNCADLCQLKSWATVPWAMKVLVALEMTLHLNGIITPQHLT